MYSRLDARAFEPAIRFEVVSCAESVCNPTKIYRGRSVELAVRMPLGGRAVIDGNSGL